MNYLLETSVAPSTPTLFGIGATIVGTMGTVVTILWKNFVSRVDRTEKKLDQCEEKHEKANSEMLSITREVGELKGKVDGITEMSNRVLEEVHFAVKTKNSNDP